MQTCVLAAIVQNLAPSPTSCCFWEPPRLKAITLMSRLCRHLPDGKGSIEQAVKTRCGSYSTTDESLLKHQGALQASVADLEYQRIAVSCNRHGADADAGGTFRDDSHIPYPLQSWGVYTAAYLSVTDDVFWRRRRSTSSSTAPCATPSACLVATPRCSLTPFLRAP